MHCDTHYISPVSCPSCQLLPLCPSFSPILLSCPSLLFTLAFPKSPRFLLLNFSFPFFPPLLLPPSTPPFVPFLYLLPLHFTSFLSPSPSSLLNLHLPPPPSTGGLAVDWVTGKLYWSDAGKVSIEVADLEGKNKTVIFSEGLDRPWAIVLEPTLR